MAEAGNERYLRSIQLLNFGGLFITKHMVTTKLAETGESIDSVLTKFKKQLDREFGKNNNQYAKLFPATGEANIAEWDIQLLTKVLLIVFQDKLSQEQRLHIRQLNGVRNEIAHDFNLDEDSYKRIKDDTIGSLRTLSSFYDAKIQQTCNEHINKSLQGLLDAESIHQTLAFFDDKLETVLKKFENVGQTVDEAKEAVVEKIDGVCHKMQELENTLVEKLETLMVEKELRVTMQTELFVKAQNQELTNFIEKKIEELLQNVDSVCQQVQMPDSYQDIRKAAQELLDLFTQLKDVIYKGCKRRCIELCFECTSCEGLQNLLRLFHSDLYKKVLTKLALAIKQNFQLTCPVFITSQIPQATVLKIAQELDIDCNPARNSKQPPGNIDLPLLPEQNTEVATIGKKENVPPSSRGCDLARGIQLDMECLSVEGIRNVIKLFKEDKISTKLQKLQDALTKHYGEPIKIEALVNIQELINLLTIEETERVEDAENEVLPVDDTNTEVEQDDGSDHTLRMPRHQQKIPTEDRESEKHDLEHLADTDETASDERQSNTVKAREDERHVSEHTRMIDTDKTASGKRQESTKRGRSVEQGRGYGSFVGWLTGDTWREIERLESEKQKQIAIQDRIRILEIEKNELERKMRDLEKQKDIDLREMRRKFDENIRNMEQKHKHKREAIEDQRDELEALQIKQNAEFIRQHKTLKEVFQIKRGAWEEQKQEFEKKLEATETAKRQEEEELQSVIDARLAMPWRIFESGGSWTKEYQDRLIEEIKENMMPVEIQVKDARILVLGSIKAGKSSFINSIASIDCGRLASPMLVGQTSRSLTRQLEEYKPVRILKDFRILDTMGLEEQDGQGFNVQDLVYLVRGNIMRHYKFNPNNPISESESKHFKKDPSPEDQVYCIVVVLDSNVVYSETIPDEVKNKIVELQNNVIDNNIPTVLLLTKIDELCDKVADDISTTFQSRKVYDALLKAKDIFGVPEMNIFPVKCYSNEPELKTDVNILLLLALRKIIQMVNDRLMMI